MVKLKENGYTPILPFDITYGERYRIYNEMEYERDLTLCNRDTIRLNSGNVYKYYQVNVMKPREIGGSHEHKELELLGA